MSQRLIDDIRAFHQFRRPRVVQNSVRKAWEKYSRELWPTLKDPDLTIVTINGVAIYYFETNRREYWNLHKRDHFADLVPPRPAMWFEYDIPRRMNSETFGSLDFMKVKTVREPRAGALVLRCNRGQVTGLGIPADAKWIVVIETFIDFGTKPWPEIEGPHGAWSFALDDKGQLLDQPTCQSFTGNNRAAQQAVLDWQSAIHPPLLALSWLPRDLPEDMTEITL